MRKSKMIRQQKAARRRRLLYLKAWLPTITVAILFVAMAIPCLSYTVKGTEPFGAISEWKLLSNVWNTSRTALFGTGDFSEIELGFSRACFLSLLIAAALALISVGMSVWSTVGAIRYFQKPEEESRERAIYRTFFNRPLLFVYQLLMLPLIAFSRVIIWYYQDMMFYPTTLKLTFPDPLIIGAVLLVLWIVATVGMRQWERSMGLDPFAASRPVEEEVEEEVEAPLFSNEEEKKIYEMQEKTREEQLERIRKLLSHDDADEQEHKESSDQ